MESPTILSAIAKNGQLVLNNPATKFEDGTSLLLEVTEVESPHGPSTLLVELALLEVFNALVSATKGFTHRLFSREPGLWISPTQDEVAAVSGLCAQYRGAAQPYLTLLRIAWLPQTVEGSCLAVVVGHAEDIMTGTALCNVALHLGTAK